MDDNKSIDMFSVKQAIIEELSLGNDNISRLANTYNISRQTIYNWKNDDNFLSAVEQRKNKLMKDRQSAANIKLCGYITQAIENIVDIANNPDTPPATRLSANVEILNRTLGKASGQRELRPNNTQINITNNNKADTTIDDLISEIIDVDSNDDK